MNFVLHHHLAHRDLGSPGAAVGAMLPDFWRMADRRMRPQKSFEGEVVDQQLWDVMLGIDHHLWCDAWFHKDPAFTEGERATSEALKAAGFETPKMVLMAHVCWELCLDGALLRLHGIEQEVEQLQRNVERTAESVLNRAASLHRSAKRTPPADFDRRLHHLLEQAAYGDWVPGYSLGRGVADRLAGVRRRIGLPAMSADDRDRLAAVCDRLLESAEEPIKALLMRPVWSPPLSRPLGRPLSRPVSRPLVTPR